MSLTLLILAAGMGSRYGGLKQLDGVGPHGETIMDYSIFDAKRAGFDHVVFVIRRDFADEFNEKIITKYRGHIDIDVVFQDRDDLPHPFKCPEDRVKPWGTNHAVYAARNVIHNPFAVINADDFYGLAAYETIAEYMRDMHGTQGKYCMVGFSVGNTMTENGSVSRGVCTVNDDNSLKKVIERTAISFDNDHRITFIDDHDQQQFLDHDVPVSMNFWAFTPDYFDFSDSEFVRFLNKYILEPKREFFIPSVVDKLIQTQRATVSVLRTNSQWFGVTYLEDRENVCQRLKSLHDQGLYPNQLF